MPPNFGIKYGFVPKFFQVMIAPFPQFLRHTAIGLLCLAQTTPRKSSLISHRKPIKPHSTAPFLLPSLSSISKQSPLSRSHLPKFKNSSSRTRFLPQQASLVDSHGFHQDNPRIHFPSSHLLYSSSAIFLISSFSFLFSVFSSRI